MERREGDGNGYFFGVSNRGDYFISSCMYEVLHDKNLK